MQKQVLPKLAGACPCHLCRFAFAVLLSSYEYRNEQVQQRKAFLNAHQLE
jgi:hypothetical protein